MDVNNLNLRSELICKLAVAGVDTPLEALTILLRASQLITLTAPTPEARNICLALYDSAIAGLRTATSNRVEEPTTVQ